MTIFSNPVGNPLTYCTRHEVVNVWFAPQGAGAISGASQLGGPFITTVARTAAGLFTVTLVGLAPKACLGAQAYAFDAANVDDTCATIGAVTITNLTKTITVRVGVRTGAGVLKDVAAAATSLVKLTLDFKTYPGTDATQL